MRSRRLLALLLVILGLIGALAAPRARRLGNDLLDGQVVAGGSAEGAPDPGNAEPPAEFAFGVVGPVRGNHAALERALEHLLEPGPIDFVVLLGDVTGTGREAEILGLVATWKAAGVERMAVPGAGDSEGARAQVFESFVSPTQWWFVRNGCLFLGAPGDGSTATALMMQGAQAVPGSPFIAAFSAEPWAVESVHPRFSFDGASLAGGETVGVRRVQVFETGGSAVVSWEVERSATVASLQRDLELGVLFPIVGEGWLGYGALLAGCVVLVGAGIALFRRPAAPAGGEGAHVE